MYSTNEQPTQLALYLPKLATCCFWASSHGAHLEVAEGSRADSEPERIPKLVEYAHLVLAASDWLNYFLAQIFFVPHAPGQIQSQSHCVAACQHLSLLS